MQTVFILQIQGWGDSEDQFESVGAFTTRAAAEQHINELIAELIEDEMFEDPSEVEWRIEELGLR
jgi:hypothetical protein